MNGRWRYRRALQVAAGLCLLAAVPIAWAAHDLVVADRFSFCFFRTVTGSPCPFCGLTRAFAHATHRELTLAQAAHPLWPLAAVIVVVAGIMLGCDGLFGTSRFQAVTAVFHRVWLPLVLALGLFELWRVLG